MKHCKFHIEYVEGCLGCKWVNETLKVRNRAMSKFKSNPDMCNCVYCQGVGQPEPSEVSSTGVLDILRVFDIPGPYRYTKSWGTGRWIIYDGRGDTFLETTKEHLAKAIVEILSSNIR